MANAENGKGNDVCYKMRCLLSLRGLDNELRLSADSFAVVFRSPLFPPGARLLKMPPRNAYHCRYFLLVCIFCASYCTKQTKAQH